MGKLMKAASACSNEINIPRLVIMCGNAEVLNINMDEGDINIVNEFLLPFRLKNTFKFHKRTGNAEKDFKYIYKYNTDNKQAILNWLASRTLLLSRTNAKKLYQAFRLEQLQDEVSRAKLAISCRALSILDNYWVKLDIDSTTWDMVNLRCNSINQAVAQVALHGTSLSLQGSLVSPEFTTNGAYAKAWRRDDDGSLWLYKLNDMQSTAKVEVMVSNILDCTNVNHCHYEARKDMGKYVCACPAMTSDEISIADGLTFVGYCNRIGINPDEYLREHDKDNYYSMFIIDYLIANPDRHGQNWGIAYNSETMEILGLHPLFDHNNAFDKDVMNDEEYKSHFLDNTLKQNAIMAIRNGCNFKFTKPITRDIFLTSKQYDCFMHRLSQLNSESLNYHNHDIYNFNIYNSFKLKV